MMFITFYRIICLCIFPECKLCGRKDLALFVFFSLMYGITSGIAYSTNYINTGSISNCQKNFY